MPRKDLTIVKKIVLPRKLRKQPPNTSYRNLAVMTGAPRTTSVNRISRLIGPKYKERNPIKENALCYTRIIGPLFRLIGPQL